MKKTPATAATARNASILPLLLRASLPGPKTCIALLLLGVVINVLVAWGCTIANQNYLSGSEATPTDAEVRWWKQNVPFGNNHFELLTITKVAGFGVRVDFFGSDEAGRNTRIQSLVHRQGGFPLMAIEYVHWTNWGLLEAAGPRDDDPPPEQVRGVWLMDLSRWGGQIHDLPLRPIWFGFIADSLLYAAVLWGIVAAILLWRNKRRLKRGLCPVCKYPIGSSAVCSECGTAIRH